MSVFRSFWWIPAAIVVVALVLAMVGTPMGMAWALGGLTGGAIAMAQRFADWS